MGGRRHAPTALHPINKQGTHCTGGRVDWTGEEDIVPTGIRSTDSPILSESLHRLRCGCGKLKLSNQLGHLVTDVTNILKFIRGKNRA